MSNHAASVAPRRVLALDAGMGTLDVLVAEEGRRPENWPKLVIPSGSMTVGRRIAAATGAGRAVVFSGPTMGGGPSGRAMKRHLAAGLPFLATAEAALTFDDNLEKVQAAGVRVVDPDEAASAARRGALEVRSGDVDLDGLLAALERLGVDTTLSAAAIAAQDHSYSPAESNRVARFRLWERAVEERRPLTSLFWPADDVPPELTRLRAAAGCLAPLGVPVIAGDTGPAALLGAMEDETTAVLANVGNAHCVCAVALDGGLAGVLEHHTRLLGEERLAPLLRRFLAGEVTDAEVREDGGHGAVLRASVPADLPLLVTGPNRALLASSGLPMRFATPYGDMMMAGPAGLLRACRAHGLWA